MPVSAEDRENLSNQPTEPAIRGLPASRAIRFYWGSVRLKCASCCSSHYGSVLVPSVRNAVPLRVSNVTSIIPYIPTSPFHLFCQSVASENVTGKQSFLVHCFPFVFCFFSLVCCCASLVFIDVCNSWEVSESFGGWDTYDIKERNKNNIELGIWELGRMLPSTTRRWLHVKARTELAPPAVSDVAVEARVWAAEGRRAAPGNDRDENRPFHCRAPAIDTFTITAI